MTCSSAPKRTRSYGSIQIMLVSLAMGLATASASAYLPDATPVGAQAPTERCADHWAASLTFSGWVGSGPSHSRALARVGYTPGALTSLIISDSKGDETAFTTIAPGITMAGGQVSPGPLVNAFVIPPPLCYRERDTESDDLSGLLKKWEADLSRLDEEDIHLLAQREAIDRKLSEHAEQKAKLKTAIEVARDYEPDEPERPHGRLAPMTPDGRHYGVWPAAVQDAVKLIRESGRPWSTRELATRLQADGFILGGNDPLTTLSGQLGKNKALRSRKSGWHLIDWPEKPAEIDQRLATLHSFAQRHSRKDTYKDTEIPKSQPGASPFFGIGLPQACVDTLSASNQPMGNVEIATRLEELGFPFPGKDHPTAVEGALKRRAKSHNDVARVRPGTWGMVNWYSPTDLTSFAESLGGVPGRDASAHVEATRAAVQARKAQGVRFGRLPKFDEAAMAQARKLLDEGATPREVATAMGVTVPAVHKWKKKWAEEENTETPQHKAASSP